MPAYRDMGQQAAARSQSRLSNHMAYLHRVLPPVLGFRVDVGQNIQSVRRPDLVRAGKVGELGAEILDGR